MRTSLKILVPPPCPPNAAPCHATRNTPTTNHPTQHTQHAADPPSLYPDDAAFGGGGSGPLRPQFEVVGSSRKWAHVREAFVPLPRQDREKLAMAVAVPVYTEDGYTLTRTVQALALQRYDWHNSLPLDTPIDELPEMHVLAIFDGYNAVGADGSTKPIMNKTMRTAVSALFGGKLDFSDVEALFAAGADHVLIQRVVEMVSPDATDASALPSAGTTSAAAGAMGATTGGAKPTTTTGTPATLSPSGSGASSMLPLPFDAAATGGGSAAGAGVGLGPSGGGALRSGAGTPMSDSGGPSSARRGGRPRRKRFAQRYCVVPLQVDCNMALLSDARSAGVTTRSGYVPSSTDLERVRARQRERANEDLRTAETAAMGRGAGGGGLEGVASVLGGGRPQADTGAPVSTGDSEPAILSPRGGSLPPPPDDEPSGLVGSVPTVYPLYFSVLIKRQNAKKHHSHRWFFEAFCQVQRVYHGASRLDYLFCTDVGTLYAPGMLARLWRHMCENKRCAACCAHQRIMSYSDQSPPEVSVAEGPFAAMLRSVQAFDFESGLAIFNGVHAALGFLPVIPGPCGLFRTEAVTASILEDVRLICTNPSSKDGIIQGNLKIAEDRILSYLLLLVPGLRGMQYETHWVPSTVFYFESEDNLRELVPQRRRWLNGTVAGYLWLLTNAKLWRAMLSLGIADDNGTVWRGLRLMPWKVFFLCLLQLLIFVIVYLMPAFLPVTGYLALYGLTALAATWDAAIPAPVVTTIMVLYWLAYFGTFLALTFSSRWGSVAVYERLWNTRVGLNAGIMLLNAFVMVALVVTSHVAPDALAASIPLADQSDLSIAFAAAVLYTTSPFLLTLMHSWSSFKMMVSSFPAYFLFLPTILSDFFAYSVAKADDWRWGTKSVGGAAATLENVVDTRDQRDARSRLSTITTSAFGLQAVLGIGLAILNVVLRGLWSKYLIVVGAATAAVGLSIMAMSFLYFFFRSVFQLCCCRVDVPLQNGVPLSSARYAFAALAETVLKVATFLMWLVALAAMGFLAFMFARSDTPPLEAVELIFFVLGVVVLFALARYALESCQRAALDEEALEVAMRKTEGLDRVAAEEARRRHAMRIRSSCTCCTMLLSFVCMPVSFIFVMLLLPLNALSRLWRAAVACIVACCTAPADPEVRDARYRVDEDDDESMMEVDEDTGTSLSHILRSNSAAADIAAAREAGMELLADGDGSRHGSMATAGSHARSGRHAVPPLPVFTGAPHGAASGGAGAGGGGSGSGSGGGGAGPAGRPHLPPRPRRVDDSSDDEAVSPSRPAIPRLAVGRGGGGGTGTAAAPVAERFVPGAGAPGVTYALPRV